jgi:hypothetical protein
MFSFSNLTYMFDFNNLDTSTEQNFVQKRRFFYPPTGSKNSGALGAYNKRIDGLPSYMTRKVTFYDDIAIIGYPISGGISMHYIFDLRYNSIYPVLKFINDRYSFHMGISQNPK